MKSKKLLAMMLAVVSCFTFTACGDPDGDGGGGDHDPAKTVNVLVTRNSYGDGYLKDVAIAFNELYEEEGYYVNVERPREGFGTATALAEMRLPASQTGLDLVLPGSVFLQDVLNEEYGVCVEEITDVWNATTINFDGTEGDVIADVYKNKSRLFDISTVDATGMHVYGFPLISSVRGIVVNRRVLEHYTGIDFDTEYPRTTDEFIELTQDLYTECMDEGVFPIAYGGSDTSTFAWQTYQVAERQILGEEDHFELKNGYKTYQLNNNTLPANVEERIEKSYYRQPVIEWTVFFWDQMLAAPGSDMISHDVAYGNLAMGNAVFACNGEYFYNEIQHDYKEYLEDLEMMRDPMHSFVGLKYNLCGAGHDVLTNTKAYDAHCEDCDEILSAFCYIWDGYAKELTAFIANETKKNDIIAEVAQETGTTLTSAQYDALADARGYTYGLFSPMYLMKDCGTQTIEIAKLFLRMLASEDAANVRTQYGMLHPYYSNEIDPETPTFIKNCMDIERMTTSRATGNYYYMLGSPGRNDMGYGVYGPTMGVDMHGEIGIEPSGSALDRDYALIAKQVLEGEKCNGYIRKNYPSEVALVPNDLFIPEEYRI